MKERSVAWASLPAENRNYSGVSRPRLTLKIFVFRQPRTADGTLIIASTEAYATPHITKRKHGGLRYPSLHSALPNISIRNLIQSAFSREN